MLVGLALPSVHVGLLIAFVGVVRGVVWLVPGDPADRRGRAAEGQG